MTDRSDVCTSLAEQFTREAGLVGELTEALLSQRAAVAADDPAALDAENAHLARLLGGLAELRDERARWLGAIVGEETATLSRFEAIAPRPLPGEYVDAREALVAALGHARRELSIHRHILERALAAGEESLRHLFSGLAESAPGAAPYGPGARGGEPAPGTFLARSA